MKITQTPAMPPTEKASKTKTKEAGDATSFQGLLSRAGQVRDSRVSAPSKIQAIDPLVALEGTACVTRSQAVQGSAAAEAMKCIQAALDLLEEYQQLLADPQISLKEMMPLVSALERQLHNLRCSGGQPSLPEDLSRIASEVAVTAQVEVSKFNRGDYV
jgi:uncharacterized protein (DUF2342 family)